MSPFPVQLKFDVLLASETPLVASEDRTSGMDDSGYTHRHMHTLTHTHTYTHTHTHTHTNTHNMCTCLKSWQSVTWLTRHPWRPLRTAHQVWMIWVTHAQTRTHTQHVYMSQIMAVSCMCTYIGGRCGSAAGIVMILFTLSLWAFLFGGEHYYLICMIKNINILCRLRSLKFGFEDISDGAPSISCNFFTFIYINLNTLYIPVPNLYLKNLHA